MDEYKRVMKSMFVRSSSSEFYDMEIVNDLYAGNAMILPKDLWVVSGEFRRKSHKGYLDEGETWDPQRVLNETKLVHFSDWPRPKPWFPASEEVLLQTTPACETMPGSAHKDCRNRDAWNWLYQDFEDRRRVCFVPFVYQIPFLTTPTEGLRRRLHTVLNDGTRIGTRGMYIDSKTTSNGLK